VAKKRSDAALRAVEQALKDNLMRLVGFDAKWSLRGLCAVCTAGFLLCIAAAWWQIRSSRELTSVTQQTPQIKALLARARSNAAPSASEDSDFARRLPESTSADAVVRDLQRASAAASVALVSFSATERSPNTQALGRLELRSTLYGSYAGTKSVISEVVARQPNGVVQRLSIRNGATLSGVDTQFDLLLLTRPLVAPAMPGDR
jgi:hypothetical protein